MKLAKVFGQMVLTVVGLLSLAAGIRWLQIFIFTDYRAHLRHIMIPLGIVALAVGFFALSSLIGLRANSPSRK